MSRVTADMCREHNPRALVNTSVINNVRYMFMVTIGTRVPCIPDQRDTAIDKEQRTR